MKRILIPLLFLVCGIQVFAQDQSPINFSTEGKDFWVAFGQNTNVPDPDGNLGTDPFPVANIRIRIAASKNTEVTFTFNEGGVSQVIVPVNGGSTYDFPLESLQKKAVYTSRNPSTGLNTVDSGKNMKSMRIQSTEPVSAYALNLTNQSSEATALLPAPHLGTSYYQMSYPPANQNQTEYYYSFFDGFLVVATENNTTVYMNESQVATLDKGEVYYYYKREDLTGTYVRANKPVAYFVNNTGAMIPTGNMAADLLYEQMLPVNTWSTDFIVPVSTRGSDRVRIIASVNNTIVSFSGGTRKSGGTVSGSNIRLSKGEYLELELPKDGIGSYISSGNNPVAVCSYLVGSTYVGEPSGSTAGDPGVTWIPSIGQFISSIIITPIATGYIGNQYASIVTKAGSENKTTVIKGESTPIPISTAWTTNSGYSFYNLDLSSGAYDMYTFNNPDGLIVLGYGYGNSICYYYLAGSATRNLNPHFTVNDEHYQDIYGSTYCTNNFNFEGFIYSQKTTAGSLRWYVKTNNGNFEPETTATDHATWSKALSAGTYEIMMQVDNLNNLTDTCITKFTVGEVTIPTLSGPDPACTGDESTYTTQENMSNYEWTISGTVNTDYTITSGGGTTNNTITIQWKTTGSHTISVNFTNQSGCQSDTPTTKNVTVQVCCPPIVIWVGANNNHDWDTPQNWYPPQVPQACSDVYIPGNATVFPTLTSTGSNTCKSIYFLSGAQLGQPQHLKYDSAYIQLNLGAGSSVQTTITDNASLVNLGTNIPSESKLQFGAGNSGVIMPRDRWNMISIPLKGVTTGDIAFGGYPFVYMRKFDTSKTEEDGTSFIGGRWSEYYSRMNEEFKAGEGFVYWVNGYKDARKFHDRNSLFVKEGLNGNQTFGLGELNGILQLPFYNDTYQSDRHRNHLYENDVSSFYYFIQSADDNQFLDLLDEKDLVTRTADSYRFIAESMNGSSITMDVTYNAGQYDDPNGKFVLLGNPYMSALDFEKFQEDNSGLIKQGYQIWTGTAFEAVDNNVKIAPMQSFIVELNSAAPANTALTFNYDVARVAVADKTSMLRSAPAENTFDNQLKIYLKIGDNISYTCIRQQNDAENDFGDMDMSKIIEYPVNRNIPEIYSLTSMSAINKSRALAVNSIKSNDITIPLGIVTTYSGNMKIELQGMKNYNAYITFIDLQSENKETDITGKDNFEYVFNYNAALDENGYGKSLENRFLLRISLKAASGIDTYPGGNKIVAYVNTDDIIITTSENDKISKVSLFDMNGRLLYQEKNINASYHILPGILQGQGIYIAKIQSTSGTKNLKILK